MPPEPHPAPEPQPEGSAVADSRNSTVPRGGKGIAAAQARMAELRAAGQRPERLDPLERARRNPTSLRLAVNAKCWDCEGGDADPNPRGRIRDCRAATCPLYRVRPHQHGTDAEEG